MTSLLHAVVLAAVALTTSDSPPATLAAEPSAAAAPAPTPTPAPPGGATPRARDAAGRDQGPGWIDASHEQVERGINAVVLRFDRFFGEPTHEAYDPATSLIRLRGEVRSAEDDALDGRTSISARLRLPGAESLLSRFSLIITGETDPNPTPETELDSAPPGFAPRLETAAGGLELRYDVFRAKHTLVDAGAGARLGLPPPPYTRLRVAQGFPLGMRVVGHVTQSVFWDLDKGFGETTRLEVDRIFGARTLARWWSSGNVDQEVSRGYEWTSEIGLQRVLGRRTALYTAAAISGATRAVADVEQYRIYSRLRRDVHRGWTFVEVEPEITWPADELTGSRTRALGLILRLEIQFSTDGRVTPLPSARHVHPTPRASPALPGA